MFVNRVDKLFYDDFGRAFASEARVEPAGDAAPSEEKVGLTLVRGSHALVKSRLYSAHDSAANKYW